LEFCNKQSFFKGLLTLREHLRVPPRVVLKEGWFRLQSDAADNDGGRCLRCVIFVWILCTSRTCQVPGSGARDKEIRKYPQTSPPLEDARDDIVIEVYVCVDAVWRWMGIDEHSVIPEHFTALGSFWCGSQSPISDSPPLI
jgi:hypothetical protein